MLNTFIRQNVSGPSMGMAHCTVAINDNDNE